MKFPCSTYWMSFFLDIFSLYVMYKITGCRKLEIYLYASYHDKIFYCLAVSNLAHRVTICNMAWLLHFWQLGDIFSWLEERAYYCNAVVAHCGLFFQKSPRNHILLLKKAQPLFSKNNPFQRSRQYKLHLFHNPSVYICLQKHSHRLRATA